MLIRHVAVLLILLLTACSAEKADDAPAPPPPPAAPDLSRFYAQTPAWGTCEGFGEVPEGLECARLDVPMDYSKPDAAKISIPLSRSRASGAKIGSLFMNPGGPGASGLRMPKMAANTPLENRFDVIGFDPRGVGASIPAIRCLTDAERDAERADLDVDYTDAGIAQTEAENRHFAQRCVETSGKELLENVGTREVVRDLDIMRAAVGDEKLNYLGFSYGTAIGTGYAEEFGAEKIRAMVLDGAVDPTISRADKTLRQLTGFQKAFDAFAAECVAIIGCPLGNDQATANDRYRELLEPLLQEPAGTEDPRGLSYNDAKTGTAAALYQTVRWPRLFTGLVELQFGRGDQLLSLADLYEGRNEDGTYDNDGDAFTAIRCADYPPSTDRVAAGIDDQLFRKAAPFFDDRHGTGQAPLEQCAFWPVPATGDPHPVEAKGLPPIVVVSTTGDPATPYESGQVLARQLGGALVTFQGTQHTVVLTGKQCIDTAIFAYLIDLTTPPAGLTC